MERYMEPKDQYDAERYRIQCRREELGIETGEGKEKTPHVWGLALSGGGIRSATFCLGVLQALARAKRPTLKVEEKTDPPESLLPRFDYLSTVSGGGYIGAFFSSLFQPNRLRADSKKTPAVKDTAIDAYEVLRHEPPGRMSTGKPDGAAPVGNGPTAWLRENGRYLTPTGSGDMFYALAMTWRNWLSLHFVIGMPLLLILSLFTLAKGMLDSDFFARSVGFALLIPLPFVLAYWLAVPGKALDKPPALFNPCSIATAAVGGILTVLYIVAEDRLNSTDVGEFCGVAALLVLIALGIFALLLLTLKIISKDKTKGKNSNDNDGLNANNVRNYRIHITRWLSNAIIGAATFISLTLIVSVADNVYGKLQADPWNAAVPGGVLPALIWLVRRLALLKDEKSMPGWLLKLPLDALALAGGVVMLLALTLLWALFAQWVAWNGQAPDGLPLSPAAIARLIGLVALTALLTGISSRFIGFLNVSSFQGFYAARLTRAYLGASNGQRFTGSDKKRKQRMSVAETLSKDDMSLDTYYSTRTAGPLHLINVTMNLTVDPAEQLVQRDRKGKPLCIAPFKFIDQQDAGPPTSYILDGIPYERDVRGGMASELKYSLTLGQWIGTSGAAFTTGLGRTTSLGLSLVLGLANVRLGTWWPSNFVDANKAVKPGKYLRKDLYLPRWLPTQTYLYYEFTAHFHGHRRDYQYLSDGGHFENTAAYELIRPERGLELIVLCDCGCDPAYQFDDLANLVRLARIDQSLEIEEDTEVLANDSLATVFGTIKEFQAPASAGNNKCALLLNVSRRVTNEHTHPKEVRLERISRILVLKPRLIASLPPDVLNYASANPDFPNQTTADQFFDEAQFESYRQLGLSIGQRVFGTGRDSNDVNDELWNYLNI
jgi:hypothetical protein